MKKNGYDRQISLRCPTCGSELFSYDANDENGIIECGECHLTLSREQLQRENGELIEETWREIAVEVRKDFKKEISKIFSGGKWSRR